MTHDEDIHEEEGLWTVKGVNECHLALRCRLRCKLIFRRGGLWEAAEVVGLSASTATVVLQDSGARMHLPMDRIAESAFASDDDASTDVCLRLLLHQFCQANSFVIQL